VPLSIHEPAATQAARWAECAGETGGTSAFWNAVSWLYANPEAVQKRSPPPGFPGRSPALNHCLETQTPDEPIRTQAQTAARDGVTATPTLRLIDNTTGRAMLLEGPAEGDVLLSAIDLLMEPTETAR
jgi:protein-disulfide isomerase